MEYSSNNTWHNLTKEQTKSILSTNWERGLDNDEVLKRQQQFGLNVLTAKDQESLFILFLRQFNQPLIYILLVASAITILLHEYVDASVILAVVLLNSIIGFVQESKAIKALQALSRTLTTNTIVWREAEKKEIPSSELVIGDIVWLQPGDKIPADIRIYNCKSLQVDESALTGESVSAIKNETTLSVETSLAERQNMVYASTLITNGITQGMVVSTGDQTEIGSISELIQSVKEQETPIGQKIRKFSHVILIFILVISVITLAIGLLRGGDFEPMFMAAVALAVGAIPEGLPAAVTVILGIGVARMASKNVIVRKLPAVEILGSTTVICSDKTGTLTENQMTVREVYSQRNLLTVTGEGYDPEGNIFHHGHNIDLSRMKGTRECLIAGFLCNDSLLVHSDGHYTIQGDPTEGSLIVSATKSGLDIEEIKSQYQRIDTIPFDSDHQYMATLHQRVAANNIAYFKGSEERILALCSHEIDQDGALVQLQTEHIQQNVNYMADKGLRVLAMAYKETSANRLDPEHIAQDLVFLGLQGMIDPPRLEAIRAVETCQRAGITVKMITGDHAVTARAIAASLGILKLGEAKKPDVVLTGTELVSLPNEKLSQAVTGIDVFARVSPEQKLRIVNALQRNHQVVGMTGDGVNDAPALKQANIGIAMGINGTEVTKEAADMILTDDNFASIEAAVEEGRGVFDNITKFIMWTLPTNMAEGLVIMISIFAGIALPILPVQILWINMTTAGFLGVMLAFEPKEPGIMTRPPRKPDQPLITRRLINRLILVSTILVVSSFGLYKLELLSGDNLEEARTVAVTVFIIIESFYLFNCRSLRKSVFKMNPFSNKWVWIGVTVMFSLQLLYIYAPFMNNIFGSHPIQGIMWVRIMLAGLVAFIIVELEKWLYRKQKDKPTID